jgi:hypothetical protein
MSSKTTVLLAALVGCSAQNGGTTYSSSGNGSLLGPDFGTAPSSLVSTCSQICDQVLGQCDAPIGVYDDCLNACQDLSVIETTCVSELASYLTCLSGATSIQCEAGGEYVLVSPPSCAPQRLSLDSCTGGPPLAACVQLPASNACAGAGPVLCVGEPSGCQAAGATPLGIGPYCCVEAPLR